jgi:hypothetical protein
MTHLAVAHRCSTCASRDTERVPRAGFLDELARVLGWRVYQCCSCGRRFYDRPAQRRAW